MNKSLVQQQFGPHAAAYVASAPHATGSSLARLVEVLDLQPTWRVLDVATGAGHTAAAVAPHVASVIASDLTPEMLAEADKLARAKGLANVTTALADAEALPFADATFDLVTCRIAAHHFPDVARFISQAQRVLKANGVLALVDNISPDALSTPGFTTAELADAVEAYNDFESLRDPSHVRCLTVEAWHAGLAQAGLVVEHSEILPKPMQFRAWVERQHVPAAIVARLDAILHGGEPALTAFLRPSQQAGEVWFCLDEVLLVARKRPARMPDGAAART